MLYLNFRTFNITEQVYHYSDAQLKLLNYA